MTEAPQVTCPISGSLMKPVFSAVVLEKYEITYYYSQESGYLKTESPYWLDEAYQDAINDTDTGLVARNVRFSNELDAVLACLGIKNGNLLDVAGGYGLLTRLMRDKGYDCYTTDKYCENLFAQSFEPYSDFTAEALFAFEAMEHIEDPLQFLETQFHTYKCKTIVFSTLTFTKKIPKKDWWYYLFEEGQHISFYQPRTLSLLANKLNCHYYMINPAFHIITNKPISKLNQMILSNYRIRRLYRAYMQYTRRGLSKTKSDSLLRSKVARSA